MARPLDQESERQVRPWAFYKVSRRTWYRWKALFGAERTVELLATDYFGGGMKHGRHRTNIARRSASTPLLP